MERGELGLTPLFFIIKSCFLTYIWILFKDLNFSPYLAYKYYWSTRKADISPVLFDIRDLSQCLVKKTLCFFRRVFSNSQKIGQRMFWYKKFDVHMTSVLSSIVVLNALASVPSNSSQVGKCDKGYFGDPRDPRGCWKCRGCYDDEICVYPGVCACMFGQMRADNNECVEPTLRVISVHPSLIPKQFSDRLVVEVEPKEITMRPLFCKFENTIISAGRGEKLGQVYCLTKYGKKTGNHQLYVSDSRTKWLSRGVLIKVVKNVDSDFCTPVIVGTIITILLNILLFYVLWSFFKKESSKFARLSREIDRIQ